MEVIIVIEIAALQRLSVGQLRQRFAEVFGEATNASNRPWLINRKGQLVQVQVLTEGFAYAGRVYPSLSAVAKAITGSHCNGYLFFRNSLNHNKENA